MISILVEVDVKKDKVQDFISMTKWASKLSLYEDGCHRYDVFQNPDDKTKFVLSEVYESNEAIEIHKKTKHFLAWREKVQDMMDSPRKAKRYEII